MTNVLISFKYNVNALNEYENILSDFENRGYIVYDYCVSDNEFSIESLYYAIKEIEDTYQYGCGKIVVVSNIRHAVFAWYRCYNHLVDDFIYFVDRSGLEMIGNDESTGVVKSLSEFSGISGESLCGKIYINLNFNNIIFMIKTLIENCNYKHFIELERFNHDNVRQKGHIRKIYRSSNNYYAFEEGIDIHSPDTLLVDLGEQNKNISLGGDFLRELIVFNPLFFCILCCGLYEHATKDVLTMISICLDDMRKTNDLSINEQMVDNIKNCIQNVTVKFNDKVILYYLVSVLKGTPWEF